MSALIGFAVLAVPVVIWLQYTKWLREGVKSRTLLTTLTPDEVRDLFDTCVCTSGWRIVDDGNPCIAQSSMATGTRQQIGLQLTARGDGAYEARIYPNRMRIKVWTKTPTKGHTIRMRLNRFVEGVQRSDPSARPADRQGEASVDFAGEALAPRVPAVVQPVSALAAAVEGWYPDPTDGGQLRWWNGSGWTDHQTPR